MPNDPAPPAGMADKDAWLHAHFDINPAALAGGGAAAVMPQATLAGAGNSAQAQAFHAALTQLLAAMDAHLAYTADHAEATRHTPLVHRRDGLTGAYQKAVALVDPDNEAKAKPAIDQVLASARGLAGEIGQFHQAAEKAFNEWQLQQPRCTESAGQMAEMTTWGYAMAAPMVVPLEALHRQLEKRAYAQAATAYAALLHQLTPLYADYLQQKAAQAQFDPARAQMTARLSGASTSEFHKLEPLQQKIQAAVPPMDADATAKHYVEALKKQQALLPQLADFETRLDGLRQQKQAFETRLAVLQPRLDQAAQAPQFRKLAALAHELVPLEQKMHKLAETEDFEAARQGADALIPNCDAYLQAVADLAAKKQAYTEAAAPLADRMTACQSAAFKSLAQRKTELLGYQKAMLASASAEEYATALDQAKVLDQNLTGFEAQAKDLGEKQAKLAAEIMALTPGMEQVGATPHPSLKDSEKTLTTTFQTLQADGDHELFEHGLNLAEGLHADLDAYLTAVTALETKAKAYDAAWQKVEQDPRLAGMDQCRGGKLGVMQQSILNQVDQIKALATAESYDDATTQIGLLLRMMDDYATADSQQILTIEYGNKKYRGTSQELVAVRTAITAEIVRQTLEPLVRRCDYHTRYHDDLARLRSDGINCLFSFVVEHACGASFDALASAVSAQNAALAAYRQALSGDLAGDKAKCDAALAACHAARDACNEATAALVTYLDALDGGGKKTIKVLEGVEFACFAIAAACGGEIIVASATAAAAAGGTGAAVSFFAGGGALAGAAADGVAGLTFGALEEAAKQGGEAWISETKPKSAGEIAGKIALSAFTNGVGAFLGSGAGKAFEAAVLKSLFSKLAIDNPVVEKEVSEFVKKHIENVIGTIVNSVPELAQGKMSTEQFEEKVVDNLKLAWTTYAGLKTAHK